MIKFILYIYLKLIYFTYKTSSLLGGEKLRYQYFTEKFLQQIQLECFKTLSEFSELYTNN